jgi:hypothetical protein
MEELIKMVTSKVGISESQAKGAVDTVISFLKDKMPGGIGARWNLLSAAILVRSEK